ncbi:hypothetical protein BLAT2472_80273 [Burkholderia latens]
MSTIQISLSNGRFWPEAARRHPAPLDRRLSTLKRQLRKAKTDTRVVVRGESVLLGLTTILPKFTERLSHRCWSRRDR